MKNKLNEFHNSHLIQTICGPTRTEELDLYKEHIMDKLKDPIVFLNFKDKLLNREEQEELLEMLSIKAPNIKWSLSENECRNYLAGTLNINGKDYTTGALFNDPDSLHDCYNIIIDSFTQVILND